MNALTIEFIQHIGNQTNPELRLYSTSVAYIRSPLLPYAEAADQAIDINDLIQWVLLAIPSEFSDRVIRELTNIDTIHTAKDVIIRYLVSEILQLSGNAARERNDITIIPWDIQKVINHDNGFITF